MLEMVVTMVLLLCCIWSAGSWRYASVSPTYVHPIRFATQKPTSPSNILTISYDDRENSMIYDMVASAAHSCELKLQKVSENHSALQKNHVYIVPNDSCFMYIYTGMPDPIKLKNCKYALYTSPSLRASTINRLISIFRLSPFSSYPLESSQWSHFASVTLPAITPTTQPIIAKTAQHADALELRVDCLLNISSHALCQQLAYLRNQTRLPIIATLRSREEFGKFSGNCTEKFRIYHDLLRASIDYIDIEARGCMNTLPTFVKYMKHNYHTKIIGSIHTPSICNSQAIIELFREASLNNTVSIAKVVTGAVNITDCLSMLVASKYIKIPHIGLCIGNAGSVTRIFNRVLTPVCGDGMPVAAPGQLSVKDLMYQRRNFGLISPKQYYLLGSGIQHSRSPAIHNSAFAATLLPHSYRLFDTDNLTKFNSILNGDFGGASVTIPYKVEVLPYLHYIDTAARSIGAVNTIAVDKNSSSLIGYNTDWIGIYKPLQKLLYSKNGNTAIVLGAGGTAMAACYALQKLGFDIIIAARNSTDGLALANSMSELDRRNDTASVVISTLPASANYTIPAHLLHSKPVVFDVVYYPVRTQILQQAKSYGCKVIQGASMLLYQAVEQFELWHGRRAPIIEMKDALFASLEKIDDDV